MKMQKKLRKIDSYSDLYRINCFVAYNPVYEDSDIKKTATNRKKPELPI